MADSSNGKLSCDIAAYHPPATADAVKDSTSERCRNVRKITADCLRSLGLAAVIAVYVVIGAVVFRAIEDRDASLDSSLGLGGSVDSSNSQQTAQDVADFSSRLERELLEKIWSITGEMNILYEEAWINRSQNELSNFLSQLNQHQIQKISTTGRIISSQDWTLSSAAFYSFAIITTIGCCPISPQTSLGMATTVMYAILGAPLMLIFLISTGRLLAGGLQHAVRQCRCFCQNSSAPLTAQDDNIDDKSMTTSWPGVRALLPISMLLLFGAHLLIGGLVLVPNDGSVGTSSFKGGDLGFSMYVMFCAVFTLGVPTGNTEQWAGLWPRDVCACLTLIAFTTTGMLLISMVVHLVLDIRSCWSRGERRLPLHHHL